MPKGKIARKIKKIARTVSRGAKVAAPIAKVALQSLGVPKSALNQLDRAYSAGKQASSALGLFGDKKSSTKRVTSAPVAVNTSRTNPTWSEVVGKVTSQYAGKSAAGIKIRGKQPCVAIYHPAYSSDLGSVMLSDMATTAADGPASILPITPQALGGPLFVQASQYQMFVFRKLVFEYETVLPTTATGQVAICYCREPLLASSGAENVPATFADVRATTPSTVFPFRLESTAFEVSYDGQQLFYTDATASSDPEAVRLAIQGQLRAYADASLTSSEYAGNLCVSYELDLYYPTINSGVVFAARHLSGLQPSEYEEVAAFVARIKAERKTSTKVRGITLGDGFPKKQQQPPMVVTSRSSSVSRPQAGYSMKEERPL